MELIDTHQHLMYRDQVGYSWANEFPPIDKGDFTLENYDPHPHIKGKVAI